MGNCLRYFLLPFLLFLPSLAFSSPVLIISGAQKTDISVFERELRLSEHSEATSEETLIFLAQSFQKRLEQMQLFSKVVVNVSKSSMPGEFSVEVEEKWTTIPIVKVSSGGGVQQLTVGIFDPHVFGQFLEVGTQYEKLGKESSFVGWFKNPRWLSQDLVLDLQYWNTRRVRIKYDQTADEPLEKQGFVLHREKLYLGVEPKLSPTLVARLSLENNKDDFNRDSLSDEQKAKFSAFPLPQETEVTLLGVGLDWGKIQTLGFQIEGSKISFNAKHAFVKNQEAPDFNQAEISWLGATSSFANWVQRLMAGSTTTSLLPYWNYFGGLDRIRGFSDNRFSGRYYLLSNSEARFPLLEQPRYILQGTLFLDALSAAEKTEDLDRLTAASSGLGLRMILPQIYRAVARLDYARTLRRSDDQSLSFGLQQFF